VLVLRVNISLEGKRLPISP